MFWLLTSLMVAAQEVEVKNIYVAPPTIHDEALKSYQPYINSLLVSSANSNRHWVKRAYKKSDVYIYDKHTIEYALDTTCDYSKPLKCGHDNMHWVLVTDIMTTDNFATIVVKIYDEEVQLLASASKSSYAIRECEKENKEVNIEQMSLMGQSKTQIIENSENKCTILKPSILDRDISQAVSIAFASIPPR